ncbi:MAG: diguanylate cyclase [Desulfobacterales bacterium]|nr:diguanylate cyclase [Desulfobacterales bacterium]MBF0397319.1 diguanylate cyclase [Desulfobacterales bacterium]
MNSPQAANVLLVDDKQENLLVLESLLEGPWVNIFKAKSGNEALGLMLEHEFALVLLDVQMPDMDGFETAELMRKSAKTKHIPIIFVTAISKEEQNVFKGYESGAVDYLFKPVNPYILKSKVNVFLELNKQKMSLKKLNTDLKKTVEELKIANKKIIEQQKSVIEEERLKVLLQMAGATAHELNQPLMGLLTTIYLLKTDKDEPQKFAEHIEKIEESGIRISEIVKNIQTIRHYETRPYMYNTSIINIDQKLKILCVITSEEDYSTIEKHISKLEKIELSRVKTIEDAKLIFSNTQFDIICLDFFLKDGTGLDFLCMLDKEKINIPAVVITGQGDEIIASQVIQAGAYDYLPIDRVSSESISRTIGSTLEKARLKRELREAMKKMAAMTTKDELTGLYNRRYLMEALERELARAKRYENDLLFCMLDLDHFKHINDTLGHQAGDMVLAELGKMLKDSIRDSDLLCRYGGEEFAIILTNTNAQHAINAVERFRERVAQNVFAFGGTEFHVTISIGLASFRSSKPQSSDDLIGMADHALYQAKTEGRNRVIEYTL